MSSASRPIDDQGQEGLELGYDQQLNGEDGAKRVIQDLYGRYVENVESIRAPRPGPRSGRRASTCASSIWRIASSSPRCRNTARSAGSVIVIDVDTGEVLAMVNQPSYNPNDRDQLKPDLTATAPPPTSSSPAPASSPSSSPRRSPPGSTAPTASSTPRPGSSRSATRSRRTRRTSASSIWRTILAKSSNVGTAKVALSLQARADLEHVHRPRPRAGHGQRLIPASRPACSRAYAHWRPDRHRHAVARLRSIGHAAAAGARVRHHRRGRHQAAV